MSYKSLSNAYNKVSAHGSHARLNAQLHSLRSDKTPFAGPPSSVRTQEKLKPVKTLPLIDFTKINKMRVKQNLFPNRDKLMEDGGLMKLQR